MEWINKVNSRRRILLSYYTEICLLCPTPSREGNVGRSGGGGRIWSVLDRDFRDRWLEDRPCGPSDLWAFPRAVSLADATPAEAPCCPPKVGACVDGRRRAAGSASDGASVDAPRALRRDVFLASSPRLSSPLRHNGKQCLSSSAVIFLTPSVKTFTPLFKYVYTK